MDDVHWMKRVLRLARKGRGRTSPNPLVGAVLVKDGRVVGEGYHRKAGESHAERIALDRAGLKAKEATLYINLEPCVHFGKTPPCAPAVIERGVKRAVIGMEDPNPLVSGRGVGLLRQAGMEVVVGLLEEECRKLNEAFCKYIVKKEPFVIVKVAATLDGKIATRNGESKWISNEASRRFVHRLRDQADAILVGIGTILKDDPQLTARFKGGRNPYRIVVDSRLRIPEEAKVIETSPSLTILATTEQAPEEKRERLEKKGVRVLILDSKEGRVDLKSCLSKLGEMGMMTLMVEGGSRINGSFLDEGLADKILLFFSPRLLGDPQATGMFGGRGAVGLGEANFLKDLRVRKIGEDLLVEGTIVRRTGACLPGS